MVINNKLWEHGRIRDLFRLERMKTEYEIHAFCKVSTGLVSRREETKNRREGMVKATRLISHREWYVGACEGYLCNGTK